MRVAGDGTAGAAAYLEGRLGGEPTLLVILGSGMGGVAMELADPVRIPYADIPAFPRPTVSGHAGELAYGTWEGVPCLLMQGRFHLYEGHHAEAVVLPVRVAAALGARFLVVTGAAGAVNPGLQAGGLMIVEDHIDLMWREPWPWLAGRPAPAAPFGDAALKDAARNAASTAGIPLAGGVYCAVPGPCYETPAEIGMLRRLGADAVGMSVVPEALAAAAEGVRVLGICLISNLAAGLAEKPLHHEEVLAAGIEARDRLAVLLRGVVRAIGGWTRSRGRAIDGGEP